MSTKQELIKTIAKKTELTLIDVQKVLDCFTETIIDEIINNDDVKLLNIGSIHKTKIFPKNQFSPIDGSTLHTKSYYRLTFSSSTKLSNKLKEKA